MSDEWKEVGRVVIGGDVTRIRLCDGPGSQQTVVLEQKVTNDITDQLTVELVKSGSSDGYYCAIKHEGVTVVCLGVDEASSCRVSRGYRIKKAKGASVSFRVTKG